LSVEFELEGQRFLGLNAGPHHRFNEAVSFFVACETRPRSTRCGTSLLDGGGRPEPVRLAEGPVRTVLAVIPTRAAGLLSDPDPAKGRRAMHAMLRMQKLDLRSS
jgi:predicted 3-demethylubiquinone-9 3-methyltransferase (glyoxalase superfamily)